MTYNQGILLRNVVVDLVMVLVVLLLKQCSPQVHK